MKKILAIILALMMVVALCACGAAEEAAPEAAPEAAAPAADAATCTVTFSTGETFEAVVGEDFEFFFQCDAPGDMGAPADGEEGAGITVSEGTVSYSHVGLGGPFSYPTSELVTISGFTGDFTVTVTDAALAQGATYTIYTDEQGIADAIAFAEEMAAQMAANPMGASGEPSGEASGEASGEPSGELEESKELDVEFDGKTNHVTVAFEELTETSKSFAITGDLEATGVLDKGVWTADDAANQALVEAVQAAYQGYTGAGQPSGN